MKKMVLLLVISILLVNVVSAAYTCSGTVSAEHGIIRIGEIEYLNGVRIALIYSSIEGAAEILIDVKELTLTSASPSVNVTLASGYHEINLTRIFNSVVSIETRNGTEGDIEANKISAVGSLQFYVLSLSGTYPGADANVKFFVGSEYLFLYNPNHPADIRTIGGVKYLFEVSSSSSSGAMIEVKKCSGGDFVEIDEPVEQDSGDSNINDSLSQNESQNESVQDGPLIDDELLIEENTTRIFMSLKNLKDKSFSQKIYIIIIVVVISAIFIVSLVLYKLLKKNKKVVSKKKDV